MQVLFTYLVTQIIDLRGTRCELTFLNKQSTEFEKAMTMFSKLLRLKQCPRTTVHFSLASDHYCSRRRDVLGFQ